MFIGPEKRPLSTGALGYKQAKRFFKQLPSAFLEIPKNVIRLRREENALQIFNQVQTWRDSVAVQSINTLQDLTLKSSADLDENDYPTYMIDLIKSGFELSRSGDFEASERAFGQALQIQETKKDFSSQFITLGFFHTVLADRLLQQENHNVVAKIEKRLANIRQAAEITNRKLTAPLNPEAYEVFEGEAGLSATSPLGANVDNTICVAIKSPNSQKIALLVVGPSTQESSIVAFLDQYKNQNLQVRLFGTVRNDKGNTFLREKVLRTLEPSKGIVVSADLDRQQPFSFVIDPKTFSVREEVPNKPNPDRGIATAAAKFMSPDSQLLRVVLDLSVSEQRAPVYVPRETLAAIQPYLGKSEHELYDHLLLRAMAENRTPSVFTVEANQFLTMIRAVQEAKAPTEELIANTVSENERATIDESTAAMPVFCGSTSDLQAGLRVAEVASQLATGGFNHNRAAAYDPTKDQPYLGLNAGPTKPTMYY